MIKVIFLVTHFLLPSKHINSDSLRMETINGKPFVIHQVDEKETLYAISRRYNVSVSQILEHNKEADAGLEVGQLLRVPYVERPVVSKSSSGYHTVSGGETLFSISRLYGMTLEELKAMNNLSENAISVGQQLRVSSSPATNESVQQVVQKQAGYHQVEPKETLYSISKIYGVTVQQLKEWNNMTDFNLNVGQMIRVVAPESVGSKNDSDTIVTTSAAAVPVVTTTNETTVRISENVVGTDEVRESGLAELIEGTDGNRKYLALHRTAKVGTILKVRNELNNREVFVRVVGAIPSTGVNDKLLIKISKSAFDRLGGIDTKFRVEVTYYK